MNVKETIMRARFLSFAVSKNWYENRERLSLVLSWSLQLAGEVTYGGNDLIFCSRRSRYGSKWTAKESPDGDAYK